MRFFAEAAWYPTALLPSQGVRWVAVDDRSANATIVDGALTLTLLFRFNDDGLIGSFRADARGATVVLGAGERPYRNALNVDVRDTPGVSWVDLNASGWGLTSNHFDTAIAEELKRQAMAHEAVAFSLDLDGKRTLRLPAEQPGPAGRLARLSAIMGREFSENALEIHHERDGVTLTGFAGLPTFNRGNAAHQYLFVNGRPVRDRLLQGALRGAYADFLARDRHPLVALYLELDPTLVDVNVHPAKAEVRFRDPALVRGLIVSGLRHSLAGAGHRAATTVASSALSGFTPGYGYVPPPSAQTGGVNMKSRYCSSLRSSRATARMRPPGGSLPCRKAWNRAGINLRQVRSPVPPKKTRSKDMGCADVG